MTCRIATMTMGCLLLILMHVEVRADLLGLYTFDDGTAADSSGNGNHGTAVGAPFPVSTGGAVDDGGYLEFGGSAYIQTLLNVNPAATPRLTMGAWARVDSSITPGIRQVMAHDDGGWDRGLGTDNRGDLDGNGDPTYRWTGFTGNGPLGDTTPVDETFDEWVFLAAVYNADEFLTTIYVDDQAYEGQAAHGPSHFNLRIGANPCCGENWVGDIDNVFVFDEALDETLINAIQTGGLEVIEALAERDPLQLNRSWNFEDGTLGGFQIVEGTAFDSQPTFGDNPLARNAGVVSPFGTGIAGDYFVGTFEFRPTEDDFEGGTQGDGPTGIIETPAFVLDEGARFDFRVGGGNHPWDPSWEPDPSTLPLDDTGPTTLNLEREVSPGTWEVVFSATGLNDESLHYGYWDASDMAGETVRLRIYDNNPGGWGHINVDNVQYFTAGTALIGDFDQSGTLDQADIDALTMQLAGDASDPSFDVTGDGQVNGDDLQTWVKDLAGTWIGDANVDGEFNSSDLVVVFQAGRYEQDQDAVWSQGDWTGDGRFGSSDLVAAFQDGGFEQGPVASTMAVPEPCSLLLTLLALVPLTALRRRGR